MNDKYMKILQVSILSLAFFVLTYQPVNDPDFGWHLASGMYYLQHWSVPSHDIFSWTAPHYPWVNHEYAADALYAFLYQLGNNTTLLLSLLFAALAAYLFLDVLPKLCVQKPDWKQRFLIGFPALLIAKPFFGVRSQVFDWLAIALVLFLWQLYTRTNNKKVLWGFPFLFLIWANIHGGFPLGLAMLAGMMFFYLYQLCTQCHSRESGNPANIDSGFPIKSGMTMSRTIFSRLIREQRNTIFLFLAVLALSFLTTFFTIYHYHLYVDFIQTSQGKQLFQFIAEWAPSTIGTLNSIPFFCYLFLFILLLLEEREQQPLSFQDTLFFLFFLFSALSYVRFIPLFAVISLPVIYRRFPKSQIMPEALAFVVFAGFMISQISLTSGSHKTTLTQTPFVSSLFDTHQKAFYSDIPIDAFAWLKTHPPAGGLPPRMFNTYGWGGEIIWQLPNQPVFIDGRMPYWNVDNRLLFQDYLTIEQVSPKWYETIQHYDIQWFFISSKSPLAAALEQLPDKWEKKYHDEQAIVFYKKGLR